MKDTLVKAKKLFKLLLDFIPTRLPNGMAEFEAWAKDIIDTYGAPDNDSLRFALATMILHLGPQTDKKAKRFFGKSYRKSAANQIAHGVMQDLKDKQKAAERAAQEDAAKQLSLAEATATPAAVAPNATQ